MTDKTTKPETESAGSARAAARPGLDMKSAIIKRSIELNGHKTSVSLEDEFWTSLRTIANQQDVSLPTLLQTIDAGRHGANLSSAIRVFVLSHYRNRGAPDAEQRLPPPRPANF